MDVILLVVEYEIGTPFSLSKILLYPLVSAIDSEKSRLDCFIQGGKGRINVNGFELAISILLTSFNFKVISLGYLDQSGLDILAFALDDSRIFLFEYGRNQPRRKASNCARTLENIKGKFPQFNFRGVIACVEKGPPHDRIDIGSSQIGIIDIDDIKRLVEVAKFTDESSIVIEMIEKSRLPDVDF